MSIVRASPYQNDIILNFNKIFGIIRNYKQLSTEISTLVIVSDYSFP